MSIESINPATGETIKSYPELSLEQADEIVKEASQAFEGWKYTSFAERSVKMEKVGEILRSRAEEYARLMALEMGKPLAQGLAELEKCAWVCDYYAENAQSFLAQENVPTDARKSFVTYRPLGVIMAVMPWNFPFWQVFRFAAPGLMAGNGYLLKHASNVPGCAIAIENIFRQAGCPENLFRTLLISSARVAQIIENPLVRAVTLTGSSSAGKAVASKAGSMLKKAVLELGGSDPYLILEDADLEKAVETCVASRLINTGQSCIAAKRFIVVESVRRDFEELFVEMMKSKKAGDPFQEDIDLGPLARFDLRDMLHEQVCGSLEKGAILRLGGRIPDNRGAFYPPTVLTDVRKGMPAYEEETFGPVAAIISVRDEAEAIRVANDTAYGLGAAIFTADVERGERIAAEQLDAGSCFVNCHVKSDPRLPFGGIKNSGYGRELAVFGIREFVNIKTVYVK